MKKNRFRYLFLLIPLILVLLPTSQVQAKVQTFSSLYMEVTLPEDTLILTSDTPNSDPQWSDIGIFDPAAEKKTMKDMGVQVILYDPGTEATVRVMSKRSDDSVEVFHLSLLSKEELTAYLDEIFSTTDENAIYTIDVYDHNEIPFYRLSLNLTQESTEYSEVVYGTIANGYSITFDMFEKNATEPLDESFIKELVAGTHFTELLDKAELEAQQRTAMITLATVVGIFILLLVGIIVLRRRSAKKQSLIKKEKTEALSRFYIEQRQREEQNIKDKPLFINRSKYSENLIKDFYTYDRIWKRLKFWILTVAVLLLLIVTFYSTGSIYVCIIAIGVAIVLVYQFYAQTEKTIIHEVKALKKSKSSEALFTFYDEYYTLSGIQSSSKYPYMQVTEIKEYKEYIYIYLGSDKAHYLVKSGFEHGPEEFKSFMREKMNIKK